MCKELVNGIENDGIEVVCECCGEIFIGKSFKTVDGDVCEECFNDEYALCRECDEYHLKSEMAYDSANENYICGDCYDNGGFSTCEYCGEITDEGTWVESVEEYVCESCLEERFRLCPDCEEWHKDTNMVEITSLNGTNYEVCESCFDDSYYTCADCGECFGIDDVVFDEDEEEYFCLECHHESTSGKIQSYSYKPRPIFHGENDVFLGIELEVDEGCDQKDTLDGISNIFEDVAYYKHDGSLGSYGFEIITHPCTIDHHMNEINYKGAFDKLLCNEFKSHNTDTCGLHAHVNRTFFGNDVDTQDLNIAKIILFMDINWKKMVKFSRRKESNLNQWAQRIQLKEMPNTKVLEASKERRARYYAVNLCNEHTVEFRLFRGTLNYETFIASLQLVSNLCNIVKETSLDDMRVLSFKDVVEHRHFEELSSYVDKKDIYDVDNEHYEIEKVFPQILDDKDFTFGKKVTFAKDLFDKALDSKLYKNYNDSFTTILRSEKDWYIVEIKGNQIKVSNGLKSCFIEKCFVLELSDKGFFNEAEMELNRKAFLNNPLERVSLPKGTVVKIVVDIDQLRMLGVEPDGGWGDGMRSENFPLGKVYTVSDDHYYSVWLENEYYRWDNRFFELVEEKENN